MEKTIKISTSIKFNGEEYTGKPVEVTNEELNIASDFMKNVAKGNATYLMLETNYGKVYFTPEILKQSIIFINYL